MDSNAMSPWVGLSKGLRKSQSSQLEQLLVSCWLQPQQKSAENSAGSCLERAVAGLGTSGTLSLSDGMADVLPTPVTSCVAHKVPQNTGDIAYISVSSNVL